MNDKAESTPTDPADAVERTAWYAWWSSKTGTYVAFAILTVVAGVLLFGKLAALGIWEPWESNEISIAREYAERVAADEQDGADDQPARAEQADAANQPNWATPTLDGEPVARPLLKTWLISLSAGKPDVEAQFEVGQLERSSRLPIAVGVFLLVLLAFLWIKAHFDTWSALLCAVAFVTTPAVFLGAHTVSTELLFLVVSSAAVMAYFQLVQATEPNKRWLWGVLLGISLALCFLEQRYFGLLTPLTVMIGFAVTQLPFEQISMARQSPAGVASLVGKRDIALAVASLLGAGGVLLWGVMRSSEAPENTYFLPHVVQWIAVLVPVFVLLAGVFLARKTRAIQSMLSPQGAFAGAIVALVVAVVVSAYGDANPVSRVEGEIAGKMPLFTFLLENELLTKSLAKDHLHFAMWVRQLGFTLVPWVALVPLGIGYLARSTRLEDDEGKPRLDLTSTRESAKRLLLVWAFFGAAAVAVASAWGHYYFAAYLPLLAGVGLMLGDADFWKMARLHSLLAYLMGFVAIATTLMLGKDLERFPARFMEAYLGFQEDLDLPKDFGYGKTLKALKYGWMLLMASFFFGLVTWVALTAHSIKTLPERLRKWRERRGAEDAVAADEEMSPLRRRALQKEEYRAKSTPWAALARLVELPSTWGALVAVAGIATAGVFLFSFAPSLSAHLSQRGIFQTYTEHADEGEQLYRYNVSVGDSSVYLGDVESISRSQAFMQKFDADERFFVVIPRTRLAALNYEIRQRFGRDLPVLDASSSRLLLASNQLEEGEEQKNFIGDAIVDNPEEFEPAIPLKFAQNGRIVNAAFDNRLEMIGWDIDRKPEDGTFPTYKWGEKAKLTFYFRVKKRVPGQQKIFMHVDYPGSRIHGDHDPIGGDFPTNYWLPGDIVKDEYELNIDSYSSPGVYTIWMGFYRGNDRMKVTPSQAHDGQNRMLVGKIRVEGML